LVPLLLSFASHRGDSGRLSRNHIRRVRGFPLYYGTRRLDWSIPEGDTHDDSLISELFVVIEDLLDGDDTRILMWRIILFSGRFIPELGCYPRAYQSKILPTNGEMSVTPASAQATACVNENSKVKLQ
jgi:hypothetical protein